MWESVRRRWREVDGLCEWRWRESVGMIERETMVEGGRESAVSSTPHLHPLCILSPSISASPPHPRTPPRPITRPAFSPLFRRILILPHPHPRFIIISAVSPDARPELPTLSTLRPEFTHGPRQTFPHHHRDWASRGWDGFDTG